LAQAKKMTGRGVRFIALLGVTYFAKEGIKHLSNAERVASEPRHMVVRTLDRYKQYVPCHLGIDGIAWNYKLSDYATFFL
jgi:hypothetical protein